MKNRAGSESVGEEIYTKEAGTAESGREQSGSFAEITVLWKWRSKR